MTKKEQIKKINELLKEAYETYFSYHHPRTGNYEKEKADWSATRLIVIEETITTLFPEYNIEWHETRWYNELMKEYRERRGS